MPKRGENIYKRKDGRWEGRYIKCRTLHGRIQYGYVYGKSYSEVKSKLKETTSMPIQTSDSRAPQPTSYSEILKMWLLSAKNHVKDSTFSRYNHLVERHIQPFLGGYQIGEIRNALLEKYIDHLLQCGRLDGSGGLSPKSVSDILVVIKRSMRYAQENNHLVICSTAGLSVKRSRKNIVVYTNGTVLPNETQLAALQADNVWVHISDYGPCSKHLSKLEALFTERGIRFFSKRYDTWQSTGNLCLREEDESRLAWKYERCFKARCYSLFEDKLYGCARASNGAAAGQLPERDYVSFSENRTPLQDRAELMKLFSLPYLNACRYCGGMIEGNADIIPAIQQTD